MNTILSVLAVLCAIAVFWRTVKLIGNMDWRPRAMPYPQFLVFGMSRAGLCILTIGCAIVIVERHADLWAYLLVYSVGGSTIFDRRKHA